MKLVFTIEFDIDEGMPAPERCEEIASELEDEAAGRMLSAGGSWSVWATYKVEL